MTVRREAGLVLGDSAMLSIAARRLRIAGQEAKLGGRAFDVLVALVERRDRVVPMQELLDLVWPGLVVEENNLHVHVRALRKLLGGDAIATVSGRGYRFVLPTLSTDAAAPVDGTGPDSELLGRGALLAELAALLARDAARVITLTGAGGSGKSRLALHATATQAMRCRDGAYTVMLSAVRDPAHVMAAIAATLGLQESSGAPVDDLVASFLAPRELLLTLDNLEHLLPAASVLEGLLQRAPGLRLMLTSRSPTRIAGEIEVRVPPLGLPVDDTHQARRAAPAVQLFLRCARAAGRALVDPDHEATQGDDELRAAVEICTRLDGLPLAIELAAARLRVLTPQALAGRLQHALPLLTVGPAEAPARHQTLRAAMAWSHDLLDPAAQQLFARLAVFAGGWTLEAAEAIAEDRAAVIDRLEQLLDHNLVQRVDDVLGQPRYSMLETIREFALERLMGAGEEAQVRDSHADFYSRLAQLAAPQFTGGERRVALARVQADRHNLRAALAWLIHQRRDAAAALPLAAAMVWPWYFEGLYGEGRGWIDAALALPGKATAPAARAELLSGAARLATYSGDSMAAFGHAEHSIALWRQLDDSRGLAFALYHQGIAAIASAQVERAFPALAESLDCFTALQDAWGMALAQSYLGTAYALLPGTEERAGLLLREGRAGFRALGDDWGMTVSSHYLGSIALRTGDFAAAWELTHEMLANSREIGDRYRIARNLHQLAEIEVAQQRWRQALPLLAESLGLNAEQQRLGDAALQLRLLTRLAVELHAPEHAVRFAALAERHALAGHTLPPDDLAAHEARVARLRQTLGEARFVELRAEGGVASIAAAAAAARELGG